MAYIETWVNQEMTKPVKVNYLGGTLFSQDVQGNLIGVRLTKNGEAYADGGTVSGNVIRADGGTVAITGSISGNKAQIILPAAAYAVVGAVTIIIKLTQNGQTATIGAFVGMVYASSTDTVVDPGTIIPSIADLIAQIQAAVGSIPADYSALNQEVTDLKSAFGIVNNSLEQFKDGIDISNTFMNYQVGKRVSQSGTTSAFVVADNPAFACANFIPVNVNESYTVHVASGYKVYAWCTDVSSLNDSTGHYRVLTTGWQTSDFAVNCAYPYLILSVTTSDGTNIGDPYLVYLEQNIRTLVYAKKTEVDESVNAVKSNLDLFKSGVNMVLPEIDFTYGKKLSLGTGSAFSETNDPAFANIKFLEVPTDKTIAIGIAEGYQVYAWCTDVTTLGDESGNFRILTTGWQTDDISVSCAYPYLMVSITTSDGSAIADGKPVSVSYADLPIYQTKENVEKIIIDSFNKNSLGYNAIYPELVFKRGRVQLNGVQMYVTTGDNAFIYSENLLRIGKPIGIVIAEGFRALCYLGDDYASEGGTVSGTASWVSGPSKIDFPKNEKYPHVIICVTKSNGSAITASEAADAVMVVYHAVDVDFTARATQGQITYLADTKNSSVGNYIVNAIAYDDGTIVACRSNGTVVKIGYDNTETVLLTVNGTNMDWRLCWKDSQDNVFVSPHATIGTLDLSDRGLYRLAKGDSEFVKVISLYNPQSDIPTERDSTDNKDTIWTMCEDDSGNLYAGVYAHGERENPAIYKSSDHGQYWFYQTNFIDNGLVTAPLGRHMHAVAYSKWTKALYAIVGEVNTIFRSKNGGTSWTDLGITLNVKGTVLHPTPHGILVGSDGTYNIDIDLVLLDDKTYVNVFNGWANTVFAIRKSDITGWLYAFTKLDVSVSDAAIFPPLSAVDATGTQLETILSTWHSQVGDTAYIAWRNYYNSIYASYPSDSIRPQHFGILVSKDDGATWEVCKRWKVPSTSYYGIWCVGQFINGECLCSRLTEAGITNPIVISEGKHKYQATGCNLDGEIFVRTNTSEIVELY